MLKRRNLLKKSALSGIALLTLESCYNSSKIPPAPDSLGHSFKFLNPKDRGILSKIIPVVLAESLPHSLQERVLAIKEVIIGWDIAVVGLPILVQNDIKRLFLVMDSHFIFSLTPRLITGVPDAWDNHLEIENFLNDWKHSDPENLITGNDLRVGYMALVELTMASWYANSRSWEFCGYLGPPNFSSS